uniref:autotransporter domain-containing protein n=1 Tax=Bordetella sputigena TaxID=1416810 RepID=UPI0039F0A89F
MLQQGAFPNDTYTVSSDVVGGKGGQGASTADGDGGAGGGGGGGAGILMSGTGLTLTVPGGYTIGGGAGGAGGDAAAFTSFGIAGSGGGGGAGVLATANSRVLNAGTILGGNGGAAGGGGLSVSGGRPAGPAGDSGGTGGGNGGGTASSGTFGTYPLPGGGGAGVVLPSGATLGNSGTVIGGDAGSVGQSPIPGAAAGGPGVIGMGNTVVENAGVIIGGQGSPQAGRANAIDFLNSGNLLILDAGSRITGNVVSHLGVDALRLGGDTTDASTVFDVSQLGAVGSGAQYQGFINYSKTGASTWTLTGVATKATPWTIAGGTLAVSQEASLGTPASTLTLSGGTLRWNAAFGMAASRQVSVTGDSTLDTNGFAATINAPVSGSAKLTKAGGGTLTLAGDMAFTGALDVQGGTLRLGIGDAAVTPSPSAINLDGQLVVDYAGNATFPGDISGTGPLIKQGAGRLTLGGLSPLGGIEVNQGTLEVASASQLRVQSVMLGGGTLAVGQGAFNQMLAFSGGTTGTVHIAGPDPFAHNGSLLMGPGATARFTADTATELLESPTTMGVVATSAIEIGQGVTLRGNSVFDTGLATLGTLSIDGGGALISQTPSGLTVNNLQGGGTLQGYALSVAQGDFSGALDVSSLSKTGPGRLVLSDAYVVNSSGIDIAGGTLVANSNLGAANPVTVRNGATLAGNGTVGTTVIADGGTLAPGDQGGTLGVQGDLALSAQSRLAYALGSGGTSANPAGGASSRVAVLRNLTLDGVLDLSPSTVPADGTAAAGYYRLFTYGGVLDDLGLQVDASAMPSSIAAYEVLAGNGHVDLAIGSPGSDMLQQWQGGSGNWDGASLSWANENGDVPAAWAGKVAVFKDGGSQGGTIAVQGAQSFQGLQFVDNGYTLSGPGTLQVDGSANADGNAEIRVLADRATIAAAIAGAGGITKTEAGTLVLSGANTYAGGTVLAGGTVQVAGDGNLGALSGALTFNGGTLHTTTAFATARPVNLRAGGGVFQTDGDLALAGTVQGPGGLTKTGPGTLTLVASNAYQGGTAIDGGVVAVSADDKLGAATGGLSFDGGTLRWDAPFDLAGSRAITLNAGGGTLDTHGSDTTIVQAMSGNGGLTKTGAGTLVLLGENSYAGGTVIAGGTVQVGAGGQAGSIRGDVLDEGALVFMRSDDLAYGGVLSGGGALRQAGAGNLTLAGDSAGFAGLTSVSAGTLTVDGSLGGTLSVASGAVLAGTGTVGTTVVAGGGTLAPGNATTPKGTLTVNGDLAFLPGSTYRVQAGPAAGTAGGTAASTFVHVTGAAQLAGSVVHVGPDGSYAASSTYRILTADGGVHGAFDAVSSNFAFLEPALAYDANDVDLTIRLKQVAGQPGGGDDGGSGGGTRPIRFDDAAATGNQRAVARALQSLPASSALYSRVLNLPAGAPAAVFDSLSGEAHASAMSTLIGVAGNVANMPMTRLRANLDAGRMPGPAIAQLGMGDASALPSSAAQPMWAQVFGNWGRLAGGNDAGKVSQSDGGLFVGGDHAVGGGWRMGGALGYTHSHSSVEGLDSTADADSYSAVVYGGKAFDAGPGRVHLSAGAAYSWHRLSTQRDVDAAGVGETLKAHYGASTAQVFGELGYALPLGAKAALEPYVGVDYSDLRTRAFSESGGDAALNGDAARNQLASSTLGVHARTEVELGRTQARLRATVGWRHTYGDVDPRTTLAFDGSQSFTVTGAPVARDAAVLEAGADLAMGRRTTLALTYAGQFGGGNRQNAGMAEVRWRF